MRVVQLPWLEDIVLLVPSCTKLRVSLAMLEAEEALFEVSAVPGGWRLTTVVPGGEFSVGGHAFRRRKCCWTLAANYRNKEEVYPNFPSSKLRRRSCPDCRRTTCQRYFGHFHWKHSGHHNFHFDESASFCAGDAGNHLYRVLRRNPRTCWKGDRKIWCQDRTETVA